MVKRFVSLCSNLLAMAKNKTITKHDLFGFYMDYALTYDKQPESVYIFAKDHHFDETIFYNFFGTFEELEQEIFSTFFENTVTVLNRSQDYKSFDARNKLLSFYFTFFENLTANRSYVVYALNCDTYSIKSLKKLSNLKKHFTNYIENLNIETIDLKQETLQKLQHKSLKETAWIQLLCTLKFWLDDTSPSFEKTDVFIEKSIRASFDLIDTTPLHSLIDFGKFIITEKIRMN